MAAANILAQIMSKFDAQTSEMAAMREMMASQTAQMRRERTVIWTLVGLLGAAVVRYLITG